jgi:GNAT superfamily N-acetyltransferase
MTLERVTFRNPTPQDAGVMAALAVEGFRTYASFASAGWSPPDAAAEAELAQQFCLRLTQPRVWALLAEDESSRTVGHIALLPAAHTARPVLDASLAHLWQLFVTPPWWGSGLATQLHSAALVGAVESRFTAMRLFTPVAQARSRRFYEREGWSLTGTPAFENIGLELVEYQRSLLTPRRSGGLL